MQISIDQAEGLERTVNIQLAAEDIQPKVDEKITELGKEVRLKGFRQGRVPKKNTDTTLRATRTPRSVG